MADEWQGTRLRVEWTGATAAVILDRPDRHNALDHVLRDELVRTLRAVTAASAGPICLVGDGPSFCSGGDLSEFGTTPLGAIGHLVRMARSLPAVISGVASRLVAGVHGYCIGAGLELAAYARTVVAADDCRFRLPEVQMGLLPGSGGTVSIPNRIGRPRALWLMITGDEIGSADALAWGLVDEVVPPERLRSRVMELCTS